MRDALEQRLADATAPQLGGFRGFLDAFERFDRAAGVMPNMGFEDYVPRRRATSGDLTRIRRTDTPDSTANTNGTASDDGTVTVQGGLFPADPPPHRLVRLVGQDRRVIHVSDIAAVSDRPVADVVALERRLLQRAM